MLNNTQILEIAVAFVALVAVLVGFASLSSFENRLRKLETWLSSVAKEQSNLTDRVAEAHRAIASLEKRPPTVNVAAPTVNVTVEWPGEEEEEGEEGKKTNA